MLISELIKKVSIALKKHNLMLVTAESCTGGLIAKLMTDRAGSSAVFERGFVTYTNEAKNELLNVSRETYREHGAVSEEVATEMAKGALANSHAQIAISVTGVAGPGGGTVEKPVGLVYIGVSFQGRTEAFKCHFDGTREEIRDQTAWHALEIVLEKISA